MSIPTIQPSSSNPKHWIQEKKSILEMSRQELFEMLEKTKLLHKNKTASQDSENLSQLCCGDIPL